MLSPDVSVCNDCQNEMKDPADRRHNYPFINCTNCGPRYTIITEAPYDRAKTSMKDFPLCGKCLDEYNNPASRRFHAQPNACFDCGPQLALFDSEKKEVTCNDIIQETIKLLKSGSCIAVKGLGGFHLAVDAENTTAVKQLRAIKERGGKPFAVMTDSLDTIRSFAEISPEEEHLLTSFQKPIVLLKKKDETGKLSHDVAPDNNYIGVMLPYTPLHVLLFENGLKALVMTSANKKSEPIVIDNEEAFQKLDQLAEYHLMNNRDIYLRTDDSVARIINNKTAFMRRSRGYAPMPLFLNKKYSQVLAVGAEQKNTVCFLQENKAIISQHIGDLDNPSAIDFFKMTIDHLKRIFDLTPEIIAHDLHPDYTSTRYCNKLDNIKKIPVQHHHAHIASCMAENNHNGPVIGLAFDGTGYGTDGKIWGGEVLVADYKDCQRMAHLDYSSMPGGDAAVKEPWRMGLSLLYKALGNDCFSDTIPLFSKTGVQPDKADIIFQMIDKNLNSPETSSMGRLFDGISAILGLKNKISYEGEAAIRLEMVASDNNGLNSYDIRPGAFNDKGILRVSTSDIVRAVVEDLANGESIPVISRRFHNTIIDLFSDICGKVRDKTGINDVALSGGVFQNRILLEGFLMKLQGMGFVVLRHVLVPCNDAGISLGQALIAAERVKESQ